MKRMLSVLLCAAILGGLTGCSGRENPESLRGESSAAISEVTEQIPSNGETSQETLSYPIRMVYTEKGWRFAEFNIAQ